MKNRQKIIMRNVNIALVISIIGLGVVSYIIVKDAMKPKKDLVSPPRIEAEEIPKVRIKSPGN